MPEQDLPQVPDPIVGGEAHAPAPLERAGTDDILLADEAVRLGVLDYLLAQGAIAAAQAFTRCTLTLAVEELLESPLLDTAYTLVSILLACPPDLEAVLRDGHHPISELLFAAIKRFLPPGVVPRRFLVVTTPAWPSTMDPVDPAAGADRSTVGTPPEIIRVVAGDEAQEAAGNQGLSGSFAPTARPSTTPTIPMLLWQHLRFRSRSEIRIAQAFERAGVLYFPNCRARLGPAEQRQTLEPDFLVCYAGRWGILEVDGAPFHQQPEQDARRDAALRAAGVVVIARFDAIRCYEQPDEVVQAFLTHLATIP